jgi:hypothetical protein
LNGNSPCTGQTNGTPFRVVARSVGRENGVAIPLASSGEIQMEQIDAFLSVAEHWECSEDAVSWM